MLRFVILVKVFLTLSFVVVKSHNKEFMNPEWDDPNDWRPKDQDPLRKLCPQSKDSCKSCEQSAKPEYLRLVNSLFNPDDFRFDESTNYLYRTVHIHVTKQQLETLRKSTDPIFIDGLLAEILSQTQFGTVQLVKEYTVDVAATIWNHLPSAPSFSDINFNALPRSRPILINFTVMVLTYFVCRRYRINYFIVIFFAMFYFLYEYLDNQCHRRIELNEAVEFIYGKEKNPCMSPTRMNWYDWLIGRDSRSACRDFLARQNQDKTQCGVIDLFHEFFTTILMKQLTIFFTTIAELVGTIGKTNGILITAVTLYFMKDLLVTIIQSVFKYFINPAVWSRVAADVASASSTEGNAEHVQRIQSVSGHDLRDVNVGKALDTIQLILESKKMETSQFQPSGVEMLAVTTQISSSTSASEADSALMPRIENNIENKSIKSQNEVNQQNEKNQLTDEYRLSDASTESYEEIGEDELKSSQDTSAVTINDTQSSQFTSEYSPTISTECISSTISSYSSGTSNTSDSTKPSGDSVEILSISSEATASSSSSSSSTSAFRDL